MKSYALSVHVPSETEEGGEAPLGLRAGRSYTVVDMIEVTLPGSVEARIVAISLRDPWAAGGNISYTGPAYDKFGQRPDSPGNKTFLMATELFRETFDAVNVAMLSDSWIVSSKAVGKSTDDLYRMVFWNNDTQDAYVTLDYPT